MNNAFILTLSLTHTKLIYQLQTSPSLSFIQLHNIISTLFELDAHSSYSFQLPTASLSNDQIELNQSLNTYFHENTTCTYQYQTASSTASIQITVQAISTTATDHIRLLEPNSANIQKRLDQLFLHSHHQTYEKLQALLEAIRQDCIKIKTIAPYLIMFQKGTHTIPYFLDVLDNGLELMIFPDEESFVRSIVNAEGDEPDLLFTDAYIFDFLFEDIEDSELLLFDHHNLCFKIKPGRLPNVFNEQELEQIIHLLQDFQQLLHRHKQLPSFGEHKMLMVSEDYEYYETATSFKACPTLLFNSYDQTLFQAYPHTNEVIRLFFQAMPQENSKETGDLDIKLCAANTHFHKEQIVNVSSIDILSDQIEAFMKQLFKERGLGEKLILSSKNLAHFVSGICEQLQIKCCLYSYENTSDLELLDLICDALGMSKEEMLCPEAYEETNQVKWLS